MRGKPLRVDEELENLLKSIRRDMIGKGVNEDVSLRRLGKVVARAVKRDTILYNEIINTKIEDDRIFKRRR